jgi:hypothetical protein
MLRSHANRATASLLVLLLGLLLRPIMGRGAVGPDPAPAGLDSAVAGSMAVAVAAAAVAPDAAPEVRDPFFMFVFALVDSDSVGIWSGEELRRYVEHYGRPSRMPLDHVLRLERRPAAPEEAERLRGATVSRIWRLEFDQNLKLPMPYSILGYHPGSLFISRELVLGEWRLGTRRLAVSSGEGQDVREVQALSVFRLDRGWVVLDADAFLDKLLGKKLDDSWTMGFVLGRVDGERQGLGLAYSRKMRKLYGEIDFRQDEIRPWGRPLALALSRYSRPWTEPSPQAPDHLWRYDH